MAFSWNLADLGSIRNDIMRDERSIGELRKSLPKSEWEALGIEQMEKSVFKADYNTYSTPSSKESRSSFSSQSTASRSSISSASSSASTRASFSSVASSSPKSSVLWNAKSPPTSPTSQLQEKVTGEDLRAEFAYKLFLSEFSRLAELETIPEDLCKEIAELVYITVIPKFAQTDDPNVVVGSQAYFINKNYPRRYAVILEKQFERLFQETYSNITGPKTNETSILDQRNRIASQVIATYKQKAQIVHQFQARTAPDFSWNLSIIIRKAQVRLLSVAALSARQLEAPKPLETQTEETTPGRLKIPSTGKKIGTPVPHLRRPSEYSECSEPFTPVSTSPQKPTASGPAVSPSRKKLVFNENDEK